METIESLTLHLCRLQGSLKALESAVAAVCAALSEPEAGAAAHAFEVEIEAAQATQLHTRVSEATIDATREELLRLRSMFRR